jgi:hypothetical protein
MVVPEFAPPVLCQNGAIERWLRRVGSDRVAVVVIFLDNIIFHFIPKILDVRHGLAPFVVVIGIEYFTCVDGFLLDSGRT